MNLNSIRKQPTKMQLFAIENEPERFFLLQKDIFPIIKNKGMMKNMSERK